jgi:hypothetical protein
MLKEMETWEAVTASSILSIASFEELEESQEDIQQKSGVSPLCGSHNEPYYLLLFTSGPTFQNTRVTPE